MRTDGYGINDSENINDGDGIHNSSGISDGHGISDSEGIRDGDGISYGYGINDSDGVNYGYGISYSHGINDSSGINDSDGINDSEGISNSCGISDGSGISHGGGISYCYGLKNCKGAYKSAFCIGQNGIANCLFNKQCDEARCTEVISKLFAFNRAFRWHPEFMSWDEAKGDKRWWAFCFPKLKEVDEKEAWAKMPQKMKDYIKSLPEFDAAVWKEITGANEEA